MFRRSLRSRYTPPRRTFYYGGLRYRPGASSFSLFSWNSNNNYVRYSNSRRRRSSRRRRHTNRDRGFFNTSVRDNIPVEEEPEKPPAPAELEEVLKVIHAEDVDFHISENCKAHHTDKYDKIEDRLNDNGEKETGELVVRRGQAFDLTLKMNREYKKDKDDLRLVFRIGSSPLPNKGTEVTIKVNEAGNMEGDKTEWRAAIISISGFDVKLSVQSSVECIIGEWDFAVQTVLQQPDGLPEKVYEYEEEDNIYILLNPWCEDDTVYMSSDELLEEYIENDRGCQWVGGSYRISSREWWFGQFEDTILDTSLSLLRKGNSLEIDENMADPIWISRMLSKMVNSNDDFGVLTGNWSGDYEGGKRPTSWSGSVAILKEYDRTEASVKFGQCWVFSGVLTTVCRALGLPARSVTNFDSAHDTNKNATIERYYDEEGERVRGSDSIWNYHVWNEVWMSRPDLPQFFYDGWQALDSTPQEMSEGVFQCGPTPVSGIKKGHLWLKYDSLFIFAEVNAHVVNWEKGPGGSLRMLSVTTDRVGNKISTKKPGPDNERLDLTSEYKPQEGSREEERMQAEVRRYVKGIKPFEPKLEDIVVMVDDREEVMIGTNFVFKCTVHNKSLNATTVTVAIVAKMSTYTGEAKQLVKSIKYENEKIKSGETKHLQLPMTVDDYLNKLEGELDSMEILVIGKNLDTGERFLRDDKFTFGHQKLTVEASGPFKVGEPFEVTVKMKNPLSVPLTGLTLTVEGPGIKEGGKEFQLTQTTIPANGVFSETVPLVPKRKGTKNIYASFDCDQLPDAKNESPVAIVVK